MRAADEDRAPEKSADNMKGDSARVKAEVAASEARKKRANISRRPHLIEYQGATRCSICKMPFPLDDKPSVDEAFAQHVRQAHRPGQTSEDLSQPLSAS
jgi:hypothetical protein